MTRAWPRNRAGADASTSRRCALKGTSQRTSSIARIKARAIGAGALLQASPWGRFIQLDLQAERFSFALDEQKLSTAERFDGKLFVLTDLGPEELDAERVIQRYKSLSDIESGFRVLKHDIDIAPVHHRLPKRLRAHSAICFIALLLHRLMPQKLRTARSHYSPKSALRELRRIQTHHVTIGKMPYEGISKIQPHQRELFEQLGAKAPTKSTS